MKIHYDQIGSLAWCEQYRDLLDGLIEQGLAGDTDAQALVVNCAAHFYGLVIWDFENFKDLCTAINEIDYQQEHA